MTHPHIEDVLNRNYTAEKLSSMTGPEMTAYLGEIATARILIDDYYLAPAPAMSDIEERLDALEVRALFRGDVWRVVAELGHTVRGTADAIRTLTGTVTEMAAALNKLVPACDECGHLTVVVPTDQTQALVTNIGTHCSDKCADTAFMRQHEESEDA